MTTQHRAPTRHHHHQIVPTPVDRALADYPITIVYLLLAGALVALSLLLF